jgi:hypothetical protein
MDGYGDDVVTLSYWGECPICKGPLEEVYYGGGVTKHECNKCVKNFVTSIYNDYDDE